MKKRAAGAKKPKLPPPPQDTVQQVGDEYGNLVADKRTKAQLRHELTLAHQNLASSRDAAHVAGMREALEIAEAHKQSSAGHVRGFIHTARLRDLIDVAIKERKGK